MAKKIILIEDDPGVGSMICLFLKKPGFEVVWFQTFESALTGLKDVEANPGEFPDIAAIIFDYYLDHSQPSTPLVEMIVHRGFQGIMIANSSDEDRNIVLQRAGCTHIRPGMNKIDAAKICHELLSE